MKDLILMVLLTFSSLLFAQTGKWQELQTDFDNDLYGIYFTDSLTGYICGENGLILKTTDGLNWLPQETPTTNTLYDLHFIRDTLGWACGDSGTIIHTTNGGNTWYIQSENLIKPFVSIDFFEYATGYTGWAVGDSINALKQYSQDWLSGYSNNKFNFIIFRDEESPTAIIVDSMNLWSAWNYGAIWVYLWIFYDEQLAVARLYKTEYGIWSNNFWFVGRNGSAHYCDMPFFGWPIYSSITPDTLDLFGVAVDEYAHNVWAVGEKGRILLSENEGTSYSLVDTPVSVNLNDICFSGYDTGYIVGNNGTILYYDEEWLVSLGDGLMNLNPNICPNPFLNYTKIKMNADDTQHLSMKIYNLQGKLICNLYNGIIDNEFEIMWDGKNYMDNDVIKGIYILKIKTATQAKSVKLVKL